MAVLALDLATRTGWALYADGMERPFFGAMTLKTPNQDNGVAGEHLRRFIADQHEMHGLTDIVFEAQHLGHNVDPQTIYRLIGLGFMCEWIAHAIKARCFCVDIGTWRKHVFGRGNLKRDVAKKRALDFCREHGWHTGDDNAAEACCILDYYLALPAVAARLPRPWRDALIMSGTRL